MPDSPCAPLQFSARDFNESVGSLFSRAITGRIDLPEASGLLRRARSAEDPRIERLALTPEGQAMATRVPTIFASAMDRLSPASRRKKPDFSGACSVACSPTATICRTNP